MVLISSCYCKSTNSMRGFYVYLRFLRKPIMWILIGWWCQTQFAQIRVASEISSLTSGMPGFHPGAHRLAPQQLYYGQGNPGLVPPPPGYSFQPQLMNGMRPSMGPNFIMPYQFQRQVQPGPRSGIRRGGNSQPVHQQQQQQQQQVNWITLLRSSMNVHATFIWGFMNPVNAPWRWTRL